MKTEQGLGIGVLAIILALQSVAPASAEEDSAEQPSESSAVPAFEEFVERQARIQNVGMLTLGGWAVANITAGTALYYADPQRQDFHQMNILWNTVNLGLATAGFLGSRGASEFETVSQAVEAQHNLEKVLLFNAGLDLGYIAAGLYMRDLGRRPGGPDPRLEGWGTALVVQGAFLFVFDVALFLANSGNRGYRPLVNATSPNRS